MWREVDELTNSYFDSVTLADLLTGQRWKNVKNGASAS